jgi:hypothetical protein
MGAMQVAVPNRILGALPRKEYQKLLAILEPVKLPFGEILYDARRWQPATSNTLQT